jgi:hypothetical protein
MNPHAHHSVYSLPPEGARASLGAAQREAGMNPHAHHIVYSLPPEGAKASLGTTQREA